MFRFKLTLIFICGLLFGSYHGASSQGARDAKLTANEIMSRLDRTVEYPQGEIWGVIKHIEPNGATLSIDFNAKIQGSNSLFTFKSKNRGEEMKVLYNRGGRDIWIYDIHAFRLLHKTAGAGYDSVLGTNYNLMDFSNLKFRSNYVGVIKGRSPIKGENCYELELASSPESLGYGKLTIFVSVDTFLPMRIDFYDRNRILYKFQSLVKTGKKNNRIFPMRYEMFNIKTKSVSVLIFSCIKKTEFNWEIFRPENLGGQNATVLY